MTDRLSGLIVVLESNIRDDDAQPTIDAIKQIKGVLSVEPVINDVTTQIAQSRERAELFRKILDIFKL